MHSSQNIHTYSSYIFKLHVSHSIHIQDPCPTKYLHIILIHSTNIISHKIYIPLTISTHLKNILNTLPRTHYKSPYYERQYHSYLTKNWKRITWGKSFKCMIKGTNLTNRCTRVDMLSLPPVAPIFPFRIWRLLKCEVHWCDMAGAAKHEDKSSYFCLQIY